MRTTSLTKPLQLLQDLWILHSCMRTTVQACKSWLTFKQILHNNLSFSNFKHEQLNRSHKQIVGLNLLHGHFLAQLSLQWLILNSSPSKQWNCLYQNMTQKWSQSLHKPRWNWISAPSPHSFHTQSTKSPLQLQSVMFIISTRVFIKNIRLCMHKQTRRARLVPVLGENGTEVIVYSW